LVSSLDESVVNINSFFWLVDGQLFKSPPFTGGFKIFGLKNEITKICLADAHEITAYLFFPIAQSSLVKIPIV
jgi:hypothetical protein